MEEQTKRHRGGQPGNQNARKHGFYAIGLDTQSRSDLKKASSVEGIEAEVALLRSLLLKASRSGNYRAIGPLVKAMSVLEKLQDIKNKTDVGRHARLMQAVANLGRMLYDGWLNSGYPVKEDIKNINESKPMAHDEAKCLITIPEKTASSSLV